MKETPILFSAENIPPILEGRKVQTRRLIKLPRWAIPGDEYDFEIDRAYIGNEQATTREAWPHAIAKVSGCLAPIPSPFGYEKDRLWVKETYAIAGTGLVFYKADPGRDIPLKERDWAWNSPRFMPREYSRISLELTEVRVERLQDITEEDAKAEGAIAAGLDDLAGAFPTYRQGYKLLWERINGRGSWALNPWIWCLTFRLIK